MGVKIESERTVKPLNEGYRTGMRLADSAPSYGAVIFIAIGLQFELSINVMSAPQPCVIISATTPIRWKDEREGQYSRFFIGLNDRSRFGITERMKRRSRREFLNLANKTRLRRPFRPSCSCSCSFLLLVTRSLDDGVDDACPAELNHPNCSEPNNTAMT